MKKGIIRGLAIIGALYVLIPLVLIGYGFIAKRIKSQIADNTILELNLEQEIIEYVPPSISQLMESKKMTVLGIVRALERASEDDRVYGLVAKVGESELGMAQIQEIRDAVIRFRSAGKKAVAWAETMGEFGPGNKSYYLASAFDEIYLQPSGELGLTGLIFESPFVKETLKKLDLEPQLGHRYEYKNAPNTFTHTSFTKPHREALEAIMNSMFGQLVGGISESRGIEQDSLKRLIDEGPYLSTGALEAGLIDGLAYRDEVYEKVREEAGDGAKFLFLNKYFDRVGPSGDAENTFALIYGNGMIKRGKSGYDMVFGSTTMGSETVSAAFRAAIKDEGISAIVFRIDSPGGSAVASDTIWRETVRAKEAGKPVFVSMGNVAGSGGYWVAMDATGIVAQPGTITGSIGVFGGKFYTSGLWNRLGVSWDEIHTSKNSTIWSSTTKYNAAEWAKIDLLLDDIYDEFTAKVARGRGLEKSRVHKIAKGRVWTGEDAHKLGLVDELGGVMMAIDLAKEATGIGKDEPVKLKIFPREKTLIEVLFAALLGEEDESSEPGTALGVIGSVADSLRPFRDLYQVLGLRDQEGPLLMPSHFYTGSIK